MFFDSYSTLLGFFYGYICVFFATLRNFYITDLYYIIPPEMDLQRIFTPILREPFDVKRERRPRASFDILNVILVLTCVFVLFLISS